jgi:UDP-glucose 4-epimerase
MTGTVLVTGAFGFIGRHVAREYARSGWMVVGMGHGAWERSEWLKWGCSDWHSADITVNSLLTYSGEPDVIVHCAGSGSVGFSMKHPLQDYQRTVETTIAVLEFTRLHVPNARVIYPSSAGVYGAAPRGPIRVSSDLHPVSPYGVHKKVAEDLCRSYATSFSVSVAIIRLFSIYGMGLRKQLLWDTCQKITHGVVDFFGDGTETRDWLHVTDAARLMFMANKWSSPECPVVNGGSGVATTVSETINAVVQEFRCSDPVRFTGTVRPGDPRHYEADIDDARQRGWMPTVEWSKGIEEYVRWFRAGAL